MQSLSPVQGLGGSKSARISTPWVDAPCVVACSKEARRLPPEPSRRQAHGTYSAFLQCCSCSTPDAGVGARTFASAISKGTAAAGCYGASGAFALLSCTYCQLARCACTQRRQQLQKSAPSSPSARPRRLRLRM
eukprot:scaffold40062_cov42-Tisochrysis_lutea.AAC.1